MYRDPQVTLNLLNRLCPIGFGDDAFAQLHHFGRRYANVRISRHRRHCTSVLARTGRFRGDTNPRVQERLEWVLNEYQTGRYTPKDFPRLAAAAMAAIP